MTENDMNLFAEYIQDIETALRAGNATEHTHRPALKKLIESFNPGIVATNEPKRIKCGAPDFVISEGQLVKGYIEAKDVGVSLNKAQKSAQITRYFKGLANLILTDYLEFRWYVGGENRLTARLVAVGKNDRLKLESSGIEQVSQLLSQFLQISTPQVNTPKELAQRMASLAQLIRDAISRALDDRDKGGMLREQLESFQKVLIKDLTSNQFADMYAQTICYGLFAARCNTDNPESFSRETAAFKLPKTNPFLRSIFGQIAGPDLDDRIEWAVDDLATVLRETDMGEILRDFGKRTRKEDPVVHFYETFLAEYDPKMREARGVYYTPEPVVSYIVRSVDYILKTEFGIERGLADGRKIKIPNPKGEGTIETHQVLILDPAVGTGTFMYGVINHIYETFQNQKGMWSSYVPQHLLPRLFGFELLMAPYTVAHMKLGLQLQELGYDFSSDERLRIYLTNTLQEAFQIPPADGFVNRLRDEAEAAKQVKQEVPVMVVLGNPPYSYESVNTDPWIVGLVRDYYEVNGKPLGERNPKGLLDDYIKFIRFGQWRIEKTGNGVLAFITNHGYLDNPTFRGMRQSLMQTFDEIYVLDLHGNSKKKEVCPDGSPDRNVFDIQQGVAISIFVKRPGSSKQTATVRHAELWGVREGKYHWLADNDISSTEWATLEPRSPFYLFKPQDPELQSEYNRGRKVTDVMTVNSVGIITARDKLTIQFTESDMWNTVTEFAALSIEDAREKYSLGKDTRDWQVDLAQKDVKLSGLDRSNLVPILYRPFDYRYTYYTGKTRGFHCTPRNKVMNHMIAGDNFALCTNRQVNNEFRHVFITKNITVGTAVSLATREVTYIFSLYLYPTDNPTLFDLLPSDAPGGRRPNLAPDFIQDLSTRLGMQFIPDGKGDRQQTFGPEDIFNYIYAVFHSPTYRDRYAEFLKIDFPRVPLTSNPELFQHLCVKGDRLVNLHLMKTTGAELTSYPQPGDNKVEKVRYDFSRSVLPKSPEYRGEKSIASPLSMEKGGGSTTGRVWINKTQYFDGVPPEVWNFYVGGYQVCQKWLKDRKDRVLEYDDMTHYQNIVAALAETIELMKQIDEIISESGGFPIH